jgi:DNA-binding helix-hairpin-helix protein with protein kinase domain
MEAYDHNGNKITLIDTGKGGGEGEIYKIQGNKTQCAKIYHPNKINGELHEKIVAMLKYSPTDSSLLKNMNHRSIAWPEAILYERPNRNKFIGFKMPLIDLNTFREVHLYFDSEDRIKNFGGLFTWKHLFVTATNIASIAAAVHEKGHCIGDLRETNILVSPSALVTLIDCDSFQIKNPFSGRTFYTRVGTPEYLPPEIQNIDYEKNDIDRYYSDLFGLGIVIFRLLMEGYSPYQARGSLVDDASSGSEKIKKGYFPYANQYRNRRDIMPPPNAPPFEIIPPSIQDLFNRCFVSGHKNVSVRPSAEEWFRTLRKELK